MTKVLEAVAKGMWERNVAACGSLGIELDSWEDELPSLREDWLNLARAALIALRDGVTVDAVDSGAEMLKERWGGLDIIEWEGPTKSSFVAVLNHVLQEGEKDTESVK